MNMTMLNTTMNLSIPAELKEKAQRQARSRHFSSTSDYLQHLIRTDLENFEDQQLLSAFLQKGIDSGEAREMTLPQLKELMTQYIQKAK